MSYPAFQYCKLKGRVCYSLWLVLSPYQFPSGGVAPEVGVIPTPTSQTAF
jgi:hypothetical protein